MERALPEREEQRLVAAAAAGDATAFGRLYEAYESRIFNFCNRIAQNREDAADAAQEAFVGVLRRLPELDALTLHFSGYLHRAAHNAALRAVEKRGRVDLEEDMSEQAASPGLGGEPRAVEEDPERTQLLGAQQELVRAANGRLNPRHRAVLALRELEGLSYAEIGEALELDENAVAQLLSRARLRLREELRVAAVSTERLGDECAALLPLLSKRIDGKLKAGEAERLDAHLGGCPLCALNLEHMAEAGASYRAWLPILPLEALRELVFGDPAYAAAFGNAGAGGAAAGSLAGTAPGTAPAAAGSGGLGARIARHPHRLSVAAGLCALLVAGAIVGLLAGGDDGTPDPVAATAPATTTQHHAKQKRRDRGGTTTTTTAPATGTTTTTAGTPPGGDGGSGKQGSGTDGGNTGSGGDVTTPATPETQTQTTPPSTTPPCDPYKEKCP